MKSPFPGMDPYLERHWRDVHTAFTIYARDQLQVQLPTDLIARVEEGVAVDDPGADERRIYLDVRVVEDDALPVSANGGGVAVAVAEPLLLAVEEPPERYIAIVDVKSGGRVVTVIELLSPKNKASIEGRLAYRRKQGEYIAGGVNLVEIDLIRVGDFVLATSTAELAPAQRTRYAVCVRRTTQRTLAEFYPLPIQQPLPNVGISLRPKDRDVALQLQELIDQCYERGRYQTINYDEPLDLPLPADDAAWAAERIAAWRRGAPAASAHTD